jgi:hypothetical protein
MDKESLKKYKFWYMLGGVGLLLLLIIPMTLFGMSGPKDEAAKKVTDSKGKLTTNSGKPLKNATFIPPWEEHKAVYASQKAGVWKQAWDTQSNLYNWPKVFANKIQFPADAKNLNASERRDYQKIYADQFQDMEKLAAPAYFGEGGNEFEVIMGPAMATGGGGENVGSGGERGGERRGTTTTVPMSGGTSTDTTSPLSSLFAKEPPTPEEIWLAQEDFWVKKEMLNIIHNVQQSVGRFKSLPKVEGDPENVYRFSNSVWEFKLVIEKDKKSNDYLIAAGSTLKNVSPTHAAMALGREAKGLTFRLTQPGVDPFEFNVAGEALPFGQEFKIKPTPVARLDLRNPFGVEQQFDWSNAPIRRIDALKTVKQSHRTAKSGLLPHPQFKTAEEGADKPTSVTPGGPGTQTGTQPGAGAMGGGPGGATGGPGGPLGPGAGANSINLSSPTPAGLERNRYIVANDQSRHMPIGLVLIVEPAHVNDVLIAVANSPLRIQTTQVAWQVTSIRRLPEEKPTADGDTKTPPGGPGTRERPPRNGGKPGERPMFPPASGGEFGSGDDFENGLVELSVYGIATMYERFREPGAGPQPGTTPPGNTPMPPPK